MDLLQHCSLVRRTKTEENDLSLPEASWLWLAMQCLYLDFVRLSGNLAWTRHQHKTLSLFDLNTEPYDRPDAIPRHSRGPSRAGVRRIATAISRQNEERLEEKGNESGAKLGEEKELENRTDPLGFPRKQKSQGCLKRGADPSEHRNRGLPLMLLKYSWKENIERPLFTEAGKNAKRTWRRKRRPTKIKKKTSRQLFSTAQGFAFLVIKLYIDTESRVIVV